MRWFLGFLLTIGFLNFAYSQDSSLTFSRNARTFELQHSTLVMKGLANSCLTLINIPDGLPCAPSMTPLNSNSSLGAEFQLSNGYSALQYVSKLLDNNRSQELFDSLFTQGKVVQVEVNADINFRSKYLSGQYSPISVKGFSAVRNEADPDVDFYAIQESGFTFQSGYELFSNFFAGVQLRAMNRKFVKQRFKLVALGTQAGQDLLKPKEQSVTYVDPSVTYFLNLPWKPRVTAMVVNSGTVSEKYDELKEPVDTQLGIGISPPVYWGDLDLTLEYRSMTYEEDDAKKLRVGALYHYGSMYLTGGIDTNGISGGVFYSLDKINAGIVYSTTQGAGQEESFYTQTVYVQLGWQL
jgi:hypothetical protein